MRKILTAIVLVPLAIIIVMFAVANREVVTLTFDPFNSEQPAFALRSPLFLLSFVLVAIGVIIGGFAAWLNQGKWRARARHAEAEARLLREKLATRSWPTEPQQRALPPSADQSAAFPPAA